MDRATLLTEMTAWRHHLHQYPETGFEEHATAAFVAAKLEEFGVETHRAVGGTGVVGVLRSGAGNRAIGLRADMDALAIQEIPGRAHGSKAPGRMHACGHDGHTATLLGAAGLLAAQSDFDGTVYFVFQPAEEHGCGARRMIDDGLFSRFPMDEIYGLHNMPGQAQGTFATRAGAIMAAEDIFRITVTGVGGHAASPHRGADPLVGASAIVLALQTIVSRRVDPVSPAVVSLTSFETDGTRNVIPTRVVLGGDCRSYDPQVSRLIEEEMRLIASGIAQAHRLKVDVAYVREFIPTINAAEQTAAAARAAIAVLGAGNVDDEGQAVMASEDFAHFLARVPGNFAFLGNGEAGTPGGVSLHNPAYDFSDAILSHGALYFEAVIRDRLGRPGGSPQIEE